MKAAMAALLALAAAGPVLGAGDGHLRFEDSFREGRYPEGSRAEAIWETDGAWAVHEGRFGTAGSGRSVAYAFAAPELAAQTITVRMSVGRRTRAGSWAYAGILLGQGPGNYWHLALVESPQGERYGELVEQLDGAWQAQAGGPAQLPKDPPESVSEPWEPGTFVFVLRLTPERIEGEIRAAETGRAIFKGGYRLVSGVEAVRSGRVGLEAVDMAASAHEVRVTSQQPARDEGAPLPQPRAAVLAAKLPGMPDDLQARIASWLERAGIGADLLSPDEAADGGRLSRASYNLVVVPQCHTFPGVARDNLLRFLREGGNLIALGGPIFEKLLWEWQGEWRERDEILADLEPTHTAVDWSRQDLAAWNRSTDRPEVKTSHGVMWGGKGGPPHALEIAIPRLEGWDTLESPPLEAVFPEGHDLTCFTARASVAMPAVVEWRERDGSRWIAAVALTPQWKRYALPLESFEYWRDSPAQGRGGGGDRLRPDQVQYLSVGLAVSHGAQHGGPYTVWFGDIGTAASPLGGTPTKAPLLEGMSPGYKVYQTKAARARSDSTKPFLRGARLDEPFEAVCPIWRSRGLGHLGVRPGRWVPLLHAFDEGGELRGTAAWTYLGLTGPFRRATWTAIGIPDGAYLRRHLDAIGPVIVDAAKRVSAGVWLTKAGADRFCYFTDQPVAVAAYAANFLDGARSLDCEFVVRDVATSGVSLSGQAQASAAGRSAVRIAAPWQARPLAPGLYRVTVTLNEGGSPIDRIEHEFRVIEPPRAPRDEIVSVRDGDFWLQGRKWYPHGVNYWPSYVTGLEPFEYWLHWLNPRQYDPEPIERDLERLQSLGANMVSIQCNARDQAPALNDFLVRARAHGILVNVFLAGAHPLLADEALFTGIIEEARLAGNPAVFAYDIAWEPHLGEERERRRYDAQWAQWVKDRYGAIEQAEKDWGFKGVRGEDGTLAGPTQDQILNDGEHRRMVAAYRRFVDDMISAGYNRVTRRLREADPTHLIGARTGYGGTGQAGIDHRMQFDMRAGAKHLDFVSPEGWGLWGDWENFQAAGFTTAYGRWAGMGKPVFWSEFGYTLYPHITPEKVDVQGEHYANTYRMILESGASGSAGWWFPGGLRLGENSDYGVMNPDGTPRPAALALKASAGAITAARDREAPEVWLTINRDLHPRGYSQVWARHRQAYLEAVRAGKRVGVRTQGTGTTSADCPAVAVGDVPWNGRNPPKHLNAEFNSVAVHDGVVTASVGNIGEATWLAPESAGERPGAVYLTAVVGDEEVARAPIAGDVPRFGDAAVTLRLPAQGAEALVMAAQGRGRFGPRWPLEPPGRP